MPEHQEVVAAAPVVMVVDDDPAICGSLKFSLELEGFAVRTYANAREVLDDPDLPTHGCLVIDQILPGMCGLDLLKALRDRHVALPAILITTNPPAALRARAAAAGVSLVEKPLLGNALLDGIREAVGAPH